MFYINVNIFILSILLLFLRAPLVDCLCACVIMTVTHIITYTKTAKTESRTFNR